MNFINNIVITLTAFSIWYLIGLGPVVVLLTGRHKQKAFLLAPLLGMCLLTLVGFFELSVLLIPLTPKLNVCILGFFSLMLCLSLRSSTYQIVKYSIQKPLKWFWMLPFVYLLVFAWLFHTSGYQLLVGSSDQLLYCLDAKQILEEMNTGSINDLPIPRYDHYVHDIGARLVPYAKAFRRGADIMLATTKSLIGLSYQEAFPVLVSCSILTLGLALGFLGRTFLRFSILTSLILQLVFLSGFYLFLIHVQGSLALILGIAPSLVTLAMLVRVARAPSWRWQLLTAITMAAYFSIYSEPVPINIFFPSALIVMWQLNHGWPRFISALQRVVFVYLLVFIAAPYAAYSIYSRIIDNLHPVIVSVMEYHFTAGVGAKEFFSVPLDSTFQQWTLASVILGAISYYDSSSFNAHTAVFIASSKWLSPIVFFTFCGIALVGLFKNKTSIARVYAIPLIIWPLVTLIMANAEDGLRFARSLHYSMPFAMIGLVAITNRYFCFTKKTSVLQVGFTTVGKIVLTVFICTNIYTVTRTINYLASHDVYNDPLIPRFDERNIAWVKLKNELSISALHESPVLLSGFHDTIRPSMIVSNIPSLSHVIGDSILSFWPIYTSLHYQPVWSEYNTRLSKEEFDLALRRENEHWTKNMVSSLIGRSEQAVVPVGNGYPKEWLSTKDIYASRMARFTNIGDVYYRNDYSVILPNSITSDSKKDVLGHYRMLLKSGSVDIKAQYDKPSQLTLIFDGNMNDVELKIGDNLFKAQPIKENPGLNKLLVTVQPEDKFKLSLLVNKAVKLREIKWEPIS
ncbi:MAG: hypothetical protein P4M12_05370 [Gammaproteobacteria bacterium]|nr:hypothetical protein [Gammaproteobacteria bacterium]